ncbi:MAG: hypothetical protein HQM08_27605 [Candidatus Riflebacteria bacterium]|nr:hypothetical protein [Candidatus Riflebacteria bacterium]
MIALIGWIFAVFLGLLFILTVDKSLPFALVIGVILLGLVMALENKKKGQQSKSNILSEIETFGKDKAPELSQGLNDIRNIEVEVQKKKDELGRVLTGLGKSLNEDEDYNNFSNLFEATKRTEVKIQKDLEDAFLLYKKFEISSDRSIEDKIKTIVSNSLVSANEIKTKYKDLREKYSK